MGGMTHRAVSAAGGHPGRKHRRVRVALVTRYRVPSRFDFEEERSTDLSSGGMFIEAADPVPPGTMIKVVCDVPQRNTSLQVAGVVRWWRKQPQMDRPSGMGVRFLNLDDASQKLLHGVVSSARSRESSPPSAPAGERAPQRAGPQGAVDGTPQEAPAPDPSSHPSHEPELAADGGAQTDTGQVPGDGVPEAEAQSHQEKPSASPAAGEAAQQSAAGPAEMSDAPPASRPAAVKEPAAAKPKRRPRPPSRWARLLGASRRIMAARALIVVGVVATALALAVMAQMAKTVHRSASPLAQMDQNNVQPRAPTASTAPRGGALTRAGGRHSHASALGRDGVAPSLSAQPQQPATADGRMADGPADNPAAGVPSEAGEVRAKIAKGSGEESDKYALQIITTPPGAEVVAGNRRITAPGSLVFKGPPAPIRVYASKPGYRPTAATVDPASFEHDEETAKHTLWLRLRPEESAAKKKKGGKPLGPAYLLRVTG